MKVRAWASSAWPRSRQERLQGIGRQPDGNLKDIRRLATHCSPCKLPRADLQRFAVCRKRKA